MGFFWKKSWLFVVVCFSSQDIFLVGHPCQRGYCMIWRRVADRCGIAIAVGRQTGGLPGLDKANQWQGKSALFSMKLDK
jgi:hypothetical protein